MTRQCFHLSIIHAYYLLYRIPAVLPTKIKKTLIFLQGYRKNISGQVQNILLKCMVSKSSYAVHRFRLSS